MDNLLSAGALLLGPTIAILVSAVIASRAATRAQRAALQVLTAQKDSAQAQISAAEAAGKLVQIAQATHRQLTELAVTTDATHMIVNSSRTAMLRLIADLRTQLAEEHPENRALQEAAAQAQAEARTAESAS